MENVVIVFADKELMEEEQQEFVELIKACDMDIQQEFIQTLREINFRTYIGKGKCEEIRDYLIDKEIAHVVFNTSADKKFRGIFSSTCDGSYRTYLSDI